jgi:hypothetical protein
LGFALHVQRASINILHQLLPILRLIRSWPPHTLQSLVVQRVWHHPS